MRPRSFAGNLTFFERRLIYMLDVIRWIPLERAVLENDRATLRRIAARIRDVRLEDQCLTELQIRNFHMTGIEKTEVIKAFNGLRSHRDQRALMHACGRNRRLCACYHHRGCSNDAEHKPCEALHV